MSSALELVGSALSIPALMFSLAMTIGLSKGRRSVVGAERAHMTLGMWLALSSSLALTAFNIATMVD